MEHDRSDYKKYAVKFVFVGVKGVGRKTLIEAYRDGPNQPPQNGAGVPEENPTKKDVIFDEIKTSINVGLWRPPSDLEGEEARKRPLWYPGNDINFIVFSVADPSSVDHLSSVFLPELEHHMKNTHIYLVANKIDLREDEETLKKLKEKGKKPISTEEVKEMLERCKEMYPSVRRWFEVSALRSTGVEEMFDTVLRENWGKEIGLITKSSSDRKCSMM